MPINFETPLGFYDDRGIFHPNTGLLPSPIPDLDYTIPIDPLKPYDILPYYEGPNFQIPKFDIPKIPGISFPDINVDTTPLLILAAVLLMKK